MFGILRPCGNRLGEDLRAAWLAHLCGVCLALRDEHGHLARLVTNYDTVVVSALVEAQAGADGRRRSAGPCALRGLRPASVSHGDGARFAAAVSLLLASATLADHVADGDVDGRLRGRAALALADRWARAGTAAARTAGLDAAELLATPSRQALVETAGHTLLEITAPTEAATALAFGRTAVVAGRPGNVDALTEVGRLFGRLAHLLDAVEDLHADAASSSWNPVAATGADPVQVRALCDDALLGIRLALDDVCFDDARLVHALLVHELAAAVDRTFGAAAPSGPDTNPDTGPDTSPPTAWEPADTPRRRGPLLGCLAWVAACGTCQVCRQEFDDPCTGERREGSCRDACCDCGCDGCCECACNSCDCTF